MTSRRRTDINVRSAPRILQGRPHGSRSALFHLLVVLLAWSGFSTAALAQPITFSANYGLGSYDYNSGFIGLNEPLARVGVQANGALSLDLANVEMHGNVVRAGGTIGVEGLRDGGTLSYDLGLEIGAFAYYGVPALGLDESLDLLSIVGAQSFDLLLNGSETFDSFLLGGDQVQLPLAQASERIVDEDVSDYLFPGNEFAEAGITVDAGLELVETLQGESIYFSNPGAAITDESQTLPFSGHSTVLSYSEDADAEVRVSLTPGMYIEIFALSFDFTIYVPVATVTVPVLSAPIPLAFNNVEVNFDATDLVISNLTFLPGSAAPGEAIVLTGSVDYDHGGPVPAGTAVVTIGGQSRTASIVNGVFSAELAAPSVVATHTVIVTAYDSQNPAAGVSGSTTTALQVSADSSSNFEVSWIQNGGGYTVDASDDITITNPRDYFSPTESGGLLSALRIESFDDLVRARVQFFRPDGTRFVNHYWDDSEDWIPWNPQNPTLSKAWWTYSWPSIPSWSQSGRYNVRWEVEYFGEDHAYAGSRSFVYRYDLTEHLMAEGVNPDGTADDPSNVFSPSASSIHTIAQLEGLSEDVDVRWEWRDPEGGTTTLFCQPLTSADCNWQGSWNPPYAEAHIWGSLDIAGSARAYQCGDWQVDMSIRNAFGSWQLEYSDHFRLEEDVPPSASVTPTNSAPVEAQSIGFDLIASDNNHLDRVTLYWDDGVLNSREWPSLNASNFSYTQLIPSTHSPGQTIEYWVEARDESGNRFESDHATLTVRVDSVSEPDQAVGASDTSAGAVVSFASGGSSTTAGSTIEYQFDWGENPHVLSAWGSAIQTHSWPNDGTYFVRVRARSTVGTMAESQWSLPSIVTVDSISPSVEIQNNLGRDFETSAAQITLVGRTRDPGISSGVSSTTVSTGESNIGTVQDWEFAVSLSPGFNEISVASMDQSGNQGSDSITVRYIENGLDTDGDGLSDYDEQQIYGSDPTLVDTDGDGILDGAEVAAGYDPATRTWVVSDPTDETDDNPGDGICRSLGGATCTLRAAVQETNALHGPDEIIVTTGTYDLVVGGGVDEDAGETGDLDLLDSVSIKGVGGSVTIVNSAGYTEGRVFDVHPSSGGLARRIEIEGLGINGSSSFPSGGGIQWIAGVNDSLEIRSCEIYQSGSFSFGGGLAATGADGASLLISDSSIRDNFANDAGGGLGLGNFATGAVAIERTTISGNTATDGGGIAMALTSTVLIEEVVVEGNTSFDQAGGLLVETDSSFHFTRGRIAENVTGGYLGGGGLVYKGGPAESLISESEISNNLADGGGVPDGGVGGGVLVLESLGPLIVSNSTISGNSAEGGGGIAVYRTSPQAWFDLAAEHSTISDNSAISGGGISIDGGAQLEISGTIVAQNVATSYGDDCTGGSLITSGGSNVVGIQCTGSMIMDPSDVFGTSGSPVDAGLAPLRLNGGKTRTHRLLPTSVAVDRQTFACPAWDQQGFARPIDGDANGVALCDVGSYEVRGECNNGIDDDGDGGIDAPGDPGCSDILDQSERDESLPCDDGVDNDDDGLIDFPQDLSCAGSSAPTEAPESGFSVGVAVSIAFLSVAARRRSSRSQSNRSASDPCVQPDPVLTSAGDGIV